MFSAAALSAAGAQHVATVKQHLVRLCTLVDYNQLVRRDTVLVRLIGRQARNLLNRERSVLTGKVRLITPTLFVCKRMHEAVPELSASMKAFVPDRAMVPARAWTAAFQAASTSLLAPWSKQTAQNAVHLQLVNMSCKACMHKPCMTYYSQHLCRVQCTCILCKCLHKLVHASARVQGRFMQ